MDVIEKAIQTIQEQYKAGIDYSGGKDNTAICLLGEQAEAVIKALHEFRMENKPLTLDQLRQTIEYDPKGWLWLEDLENSENSTYQRNDKTFQCSNIANYGKTWIAYSRKPEGSSDV